MHIDNTIKKQFKMHETGGLTGAYFFKLAQEKNHLIISTNRRAKYLKIIGSVDYAECGK